MTATSAWKREGGHSRGEWVLRSLTAVALFGVAVRWSGHPWWSGHGDCGGIEGVCDQLRMEAYAPASLWLVIGLATLVACVIAAVTGPKHRRGRLVWAVAIGASVFVAHRNNLWWAVAVAATSIYGIATSTDVVARE